MSLTKTQMAVLSGLATVLVVSLSAAFAGLRPFLANGAIDWTGVVLYVTGTALPGLGVAIIAYVTTHEPQVIQAVTDTAQEMRVSPQLIAMLNNFFGETKGMIASIQAQPVNVTVPPAQTHITAQIQPTVTPASPQQEMASQPAALVQPVPQTFNPFGTDFQITAPVPTVAKP